MLNYLLRRMLIGLFTLILISFLVYALIRHMPGTPLMANESMDPSKQRSKVELAQLNKVYGLDKHWVVAYFHWLGNLARFDLGRSFTHQRPVRELINERVGPTLLLSVTSLFLAYLLAVPMGLFSTVKSGKLSERTLSTGMYILYSLPSFVAALYLQIIFAVRLEWVPLFGMTSNKYPEFSFFGKTLDVMWHMILPVICATYGSLAYYSRFVKTNMNEVIRQDYIRTARAKGVSPVRVIWKHAFRNTLIPFVTMLGLTLPTLLSGQVILERIFNWPGMGSLFFESILQYDYPMIMGLTLMFTILALAGQLLADILYAVVDPRISYS